MKTRELLTCDIRTFATRIQGLKPKELHRQIGRIASGLGETDLDAMVEEVVNAVFSAAGLPDSSQEELGRVLETLERRIQPGPDQEDAVLRLTALCIAFLRQGIRQAAREQRLAKRTPDGHHHDHHCHDPDCTEHHRDHGH